MPTALLAEDEPMLRAQLRARLAEGWPELSIVAEAENGEQALAFFDEQKPDVAFLDIRMPVMSGLDVARAIFNAQLTGTQTMLRALQKEGRRPRRRARPA